MALNADTLAGLMTQKFKAAYPTDEPYDETELTKYHKVLAEAIIEHFVANADVFAAAG